MSADAKGREEVEHLELQRQGARRESQAGAAKYEVQVQADGVGWVVANWGSARFNSLAEARVFRQTREAAWPLHVYRTVRVEVVE